LKECQERLEREAAAKAVVQAEKIQKRQSEEEATGQKKRGRSLYRLRGQTVEPVFGQIKSVRGCVRFMRRGLGAVQSEWKLLCAAHNLLKLWRSGLACWN
jgi:hypothetical protein